MPNSTRISGCGSAEEKVKMDEDEDEDGSEDDSEDEMQQKVFQWATERTTPPSHAEPFRVRCGSVLSSFSSALFPSPERCCILFALTTIMTTLIIIR